MGAVQRSRSVFSPMRNFGIADFISRTNGIDDVPVDTTEQVLSFHLNPGQSDQQKISSRAGRWAITDISYELRSPPPPNNIDLSRVRVSSWITPCCEDSDSEEVTDNSILVTEDQPIVLVFGNGEHQRASIARHYSSVDLRVFKVTNMTRVPIVIYISVQTVTLVNQADISPEPVSQ